MPVIKYIDIPVPCIQHQDWEQMRKEEGGRFCNQCHKTVIDFTNLTNQEIIDIVSGSSKICGRFDSWQLASVNNTLNKDAVAATPNIWKRIAVAATVIWSLSFLKAEAQSKPATIIQQPVIKDDSKPVNTPADTVTYRTISGKLIGSIDSLPVIGAVIRIDNIGTASNLKGEFKIKVPVTAKSITISLIGYLTKIVQISEKSDYRIIVAENPSAVYMGEVDITKYPAKPVNK